MSNIIEVKNLTKKFDDFTAVDNVSFSVAEGEIFGFLGPNGAGKTTTIRMLTTLLKPSAGKISVNGHDPMTQEDEVRCALGIVFQDASLDDELTAWENMEFHGVLYGIAKKVRRQRIDEMLELVGLSDRRKDLVKTFSGGMKRRLEIARSLIHHPKILFLDEPTIGLDPQTRNHIWDYLKGQNKKEHLTIFFTTHYMEEAARAADTVAIIDHGKIITEKTPSQIIADTNTQSLEEAFLALTGSDIREELAGGTDRMRTHRKMWRH